MKANYFTHLFFNGLTIFILLTEIQAAESSSQKLDQTLLNELDEEESCYNGCYNCCYTCYQEMEPCARFCDVCGTILCSCFPPPNNLTDCLNLCSGFILSIICFPCCLCAFCGMSYDEYKKIEEERNIVPEASANKKKAVSPEDK